MDKGLWQGKEDTVVAYFFGTIPTNSFKEFRKIAKYLMNVAVRNEIWTGDAPNRKQLYEPASSVVLWRHGSWQSSDVYISKHVGKWALDHRYI